jgi:hypothetical protein
MYNANEPHGLPGDGHDRASAGTCKRPQNDPWGVVNSARKKKILNSLLTLLVPK